MVALRDELAERRADTGAVPTAHGRAGFTLPGLRWWMVGLVFLATVINYIDRQTINVLAPVILKELNLDKIQFSQITSAFLAAYTIGQATWGRLFDRLGTRLAFSAAIIIWSLAAGLHTLAAGFASLMVLRFVLGFGEAGNWPGAAKCVSEWFPSRERAMGLAIFNSGAAIGAVISPPVITWMATKYGWQPTFLVTGALGFVWLVLWLVFFRTPDRHPWLRASERQYIRAGQPTGAAARPVPVRELLKRRQVWAIIAARFFTDPIWWLYIAWLPLYLADVRKFDLKQIGAFAWVPYLCADLGALSGGWLSGRLIKAGYSVDRARKTCLIIGASLMPAGVLAVRVESPVAAIALIGLVLYAFQFWINNVQALPADFFPSNNVGTVFGLGGAAAGIASLIFTLLTGWVVQNFSYTPIFTVAGLLAPIGAFLVFRLAGTIKQVELPAEARR